MQEIRFHGRGGQGTVVASILLAKAFFNSGYHVQSFPAFGVERRGAPVEAYLRIDSQKILSRTQITTPDHVVIQDRQLLETVAVTNGLKKGGWVLVNAADAVDFPKETEGFRLAFVDASAIGAANSLGTRTHPIINTAMIGALARILNEPLLAEVEKAIMENISTRPEGNVAAAVQAYETVDFSSSG